MLRAYALIASWDRKNSTTLRPITSIRECRTTAPANRRRPTWTQSFDSPNYPDYTSGPQRVRATTTIWKVFSGHHFESRCSATRRARSRPFRRFAQVAQDVGTPRVFMGIHFRFAATRRAAGNPRRAVGLHTLSCSRSAAATTVAVHSETAITGHDLTGGSVLTP